MHEGVRRITVWLETQLPDYEVRAGEETDAVTCWLSPGNGAPESKLRIPMDYFRREELTTEALLAALEREDFPELVESGDVICRAVSRDDLNPRDTLVLRSC